MPKFEKYDNESQAEANERIEANKAEAGIPISDASARNMTEYAGGGNTGYSRIGMDDTGILEYEKGGKTMEIPGEQVKWATEKKKAKPKADKPKKDKFFSKSKRAERKAKRQARRDKRQGVVKTVETKGGDYKVYKKDSKKAKSFREAFDAAEGEDFTWDGRKYSGKTKEQAAKAKPKGKPDKSLGMKPKKSATSTPKPKKFPKKAKKAPKDVSEVVGNIAAKKYPEGYELPDVIGGKADITDIVKVMDVRKRREKMGLPRVKLKEGGKLVTLRELREKNMKKKRKKKQGK